MYQGSITVVTCKMSHFLPRVAVRLTSLDLGEVDELSGRDGTGLIIWSFIN